LPHRAVISDCTVIVPVPGALGIQAEFDKPMDTSVMPDNATIEVTIDSTDYVCTPAAWADSTHLNLNTTANQPVTSAFIRQLKLHANLRSSEGTYCRPQSDLQWFP